MSRYYAVPKETEHHCQKFNLSLQLIPGHLSVFLFIICGCTIFIKWNAWTVSICFLANSFIRCGWKDVQAENRCFVSTIKLWWRLSSNLKLQIVENLILKSFFSKYFLFYCSIQVPEQGSWCNHGGLGYRLTNWLQCWQPWPGLGKSTHTPTEGQVFDACLCLQLSLGPSRIISKYERTTVLSERGSLLIYLDKVTGFLLVLFLLLVSGLFWICAQVSHRQPEEITFRIHQKLKSGVFQPAAVSVYEHNDCELNTFCPFFL